VEVSRLFGSSIFDGFNQSGATTAPAKSDTLKPDALIFKGKVAAILMRRLHRLWLY
jgi:hypothetical protein